MVNMAVPRDPPGDVTLLLRRIKGGDRNAVDELMPKVNGELRRLARNYMRKERAGHTLQPTALVNEAYLRLSGYERMDWQSRSHFIGVAASVMRQILVDYARKRQAAKRGGGQSPAEFQERLSYLSPHQCEEFIALDRALDRLAKMNARHAKIVEMRFFGGLSVEETAEALGISPVTVKRDWALVRAWLRVQLEGREAASGG